MLDPRLLRPVPRRSFRRGLMPASLGGVLTAALLLAGAPPAPAQERSGLHEPTAQMVQNGRQALTICNGLFLSDRSLDQMYEGELARMSGPLPRSEVEIDEGARWVRVGVGGDDPFPSMASVYREGLGCVALAPGRDPLNVDGLPELHLSPPPGDPDTVPWPDGDRVEEAPLPDHLDPEAFEASWEWTVEREAHGGHQGQRTLSLLVVHEGQIVFERYAPGIDRHTRTRTWSAAKSLAATLVGIAWDRGLLELDAPLPFDWLPDEWNEYRSRHAVEFGMISWDAWPPDALQRAPDPRSAVTLRDALHMSSGLYPVDNEYGSAVGSPLCYFAGWDCAHYARDRGLVREPGSVWDYENHDTLLALAALRRVLGDEAFLAFPREALLDRIGMRSTVPGVDPHGTYVMSSQVYTNARDLARLGLLHLNGGEWNGERIVSEEWVDFVRTPAPSTRHFGNFYGGQWWLVPDHRTDLPQDAYTASGAGGQYAVVVPSYDLVVVRRGFDDGAVLPVWDLLAEVLQAFPDEWEGGDKSGAAYPSHESDLSGRVDRIFAEWDREDSPGCVVGVYRDGETVHAAGYGMANLEERVRLDPGSVFYLASVTKQFTAGVTADLALEGGLSLEDALADWFPELPGWAHEVRIENLVHNLSGIRDYLDLMRLSGMDFADVYAGEDLLGLIASQRALNFTPRERYLYSNSNFLLQAILVERVTGMSLREYAHRRFFEPLGMSATHFHDDHTEDFPDRVLSYQQDGDEEDGEEFRLSYMWNTDWVGAGAGNLHTSVEDLARWERHLLNLEAEGDPWVDLTRRRGATLDGEVTDYAFGNGVGHWNDLFRLSHGGSWMGFRNQYLRFPDEALGVAVLCNLGSINAGALAQEVAAIFLGEAVRRALQPYEGLYRSPDLGGAEYRVTATEEGLQVERLREGDEALLAPSSEPGRFRGTWGEPGQTQSLEVVFDRTGVESGGRAPALEVSTGRALGIRFDRVAAAGTERDAH